MQPSVRVRKPAVAGSFYPQSREDLVVALQTAWAGRVTTSVPPPKALVVPHAGYAYSGAVAASAYATLREAVGVIRRVVLLGPSHHYALRGFALPEVDAWQTPLGLVALDTATMVQLARRSDVVRSDLVHAREHALEVHVPFLQTVLGQSFQLVPLVVGQVTAVAAAELLSGLWGGNETLIVLSTDLSHYLDQPTAQRRDAQTVRHIEALDGGALAVDDCCGLYPLAGLLLAARQRHMRCRAIDVRTSADTAGEPSRVVGYASFLLWEVS
jgi:AmmeMemoRadiSam system protein B